MILPNSYETILDKIKQDWFMAGWEACEDEMKIQQKIERLKEAGYGNRLIYEN